MHALQKLIEKTFKDYGTTGQCDRRYYIHSDEEAVEHNARLNSNLNDRSAISSYCLVLLLLLLLFSLQRGHTCGNCRLQRLMASVIVAIIFTLMKKLLSIMQG
jgi:hypothetical protein